VCHGLRFAAFGRLPNVTALEGVPQTSTYLALTNRARKQWFRGELVGMTTSARPMTDTFAQLDLFIVPASVVIVRHGSRDLEWFCRKEHQSGNEHYSLQSD
jgi:hypothetical protein